MVGYEEQHQYRIYDPARYAVFVRRDVIFDESSIEPKTDNPSAHPEVAPESEATLGFPSFCFPYIPWVDNLLPADVPALTEDSESVPTFHPTASQPDGEDRDVSSDLSVVPDDSDDNISISEPNTNTATPA